MFTVLDGVLLHWRRWVFAERRSNDNESR